jgi:membrane associated rhomboid family serine protease
MTTTTVGMRCPECARQKTKVVRLRDQVTIPRVTYALIVINVLAFLAEQGQFTVNGSNIHGTVVANGWLFRVALVDGHHQYWRLVTSAFLHVDLLHILFNMYLLYIMGRLLEPAIGPIRFGAIYFTSLLAGSAGVLVATYNISLGASGAIFGLMGAAAVELRGRGISVWQSGIGPTILINLLISFTIHGISVGAHIGGLIGGILCGYVWREADRRRSLTLGLLGCLVLCVVAVVVSLVAAHAGPGTLA